MLLVVDVGNTNTVMGVYEGDHLIRDWRIRTERNATEDEFYVIASSLLSGSRVRQDAITHTIISCVVPPVRGILGAFCRKYLSHDPIWVDAKNAAEMPILYGNPHEVGADRIVNAVGAYERYKKSLIIIDFGTATTFDAVSEKGEYLGGAISPGIGIASEALFQHASKLPRVDLFTPPGHVIGQNTIDSMKAGIIYGYAGLVDGIVTRMKKEMPSPPAVVATGGLAGMMSGICACIEAVDGSLTLEGLRIIFKKMQNRATVC